MTSPKNTLPIEKQAVSKQEDAQRESLAKKTVPELPLPVKKQEVSKQEDAISSKIAAAETPSPAEKEAVLKQEDGSTELVAKMRVAQYPFPLNKETFPEKESDKEEEESLEAKKQATEDRWRFEFDMLKDPQTGTIPPMAAEMALEAAQRAPEFRKSGLSTRNQADVKIEPRGPNNFGGRTRAIGFDKRDPKIMIAGGVSSGIFRSTNGGESWTRVTPLGQIHNVTTIAQDPRPDKQDTWYYGTGEVGSGQSSASMKGGGAIYLGHGIWKSEDNGLTWKILPKTQNKLEVLDNDFDFVHRIVIDPTNGNIYAATMKAINRSTNGGADWTAVAGNTAVYAGTYSDIIVTPKGRLYAAVDGGDAFNGVWTSLTGAAGSWERIAGTGATTNPAGWKAQNAYGRIVLAYAPSDDNIVFALYNNKDATTCPGGLAHADLFKWNQKDAAWTNLSANVPDCSNSEIKQFDSQSDYDLTITVKPDDANTVFIGGTALYRSTDGFTSKNNTTQIGGLVKNTNADYPNHHTDIQHLVFAPGDNKTLYTGTDGGVHKADITPTLVAWTPLNKDYVTYQYYHVDINPDSKQGTVLVGGAQDNGTTLSNTGTTHRGIDSGDGVQTQIISYVSGTESNILTGVQQGKIRRQTFDKDDKDKLFFDIKPAGSGDGIFVTYFHLDQDNTNYLYYVSNAALYRTRIASTITTGTTVNDPMMGWELMSGAGITGDIRCMATSRNNAYMDAAYGAANDNRKLYIGTATNKVYRLNDPAFVAATTAAKDITPAGANGICSSIAVNPFDDNEILVTFSNYGIPSVFHTTNANADAPTWTVVEGPAGGPVALGSARSCMIVKIGASDMTNYVVGNSTGLYITSMLNGANTIWERVGVTDINYAVCSSMRLRVSDNKIALGTHGNGMFVLELTAGAACTTPPVPLLTKAVPPCPEAGGFKITNYDANTTYTFTPTGPSVTTDAVVINATAGTAYTVTATKAGCTSAASESFTPTTTLTLVANPISSLTGSAGSALVVSALTDDEDYAPTLSTTPATCSSPSITTITNYESFLTYEFTPTGPTVDAGGVIKNATVGTTYTVVADNGICFSNESNPFTPKATLDCTPQFPYVVCPDSKAISFEESPNGSVPATTATTNNGTANNITSSDKIFTLPCNAPNGTRPDGFPFDATFNTTLATKASRIMARTFTANFGGGTSSTCTQTFYILKPDFSKVVKPQNITAVCNAGTPYIKPEDLPNVNIQVRGTGYPRFSNGNSITDISQGLKSSYTDAPLSNGAIIRTWTLKDDCGVTLTTFTQTITVPTCVVPQIAISGAIKRETGENIAATVHIYNTQNAMNKAEGSFYNFPTVPVGESYRVKPERNTDVLNGVTTYDISVISRYLLGLEPAKSPYQLIAMDVNRNGEIDGADMVLIRNLILRKSTDFPNNTAWRFIPKSYVFKNPSNPFAEDFPEILSFNKPNQNINNADFVAVKVGDGNQSARPDNVTAIQVRNTPEIDYLALEDKVLEAGKEYQIPVKIKSKGLIALQFALNLDKNSVESFTIENGDLNQFNDGNYNISDKNTVTTAWASSKATSDNTIFTLVLKTKKQVSVKELVNLKTDFSGNLAYNTEGGEKQLQLQFPNEKNEKPLFELQQNRPNPFSNETTISFILPETNNAELSIFDITGKKVYTLNRSFSKGYNEVILNSRILPNSGVYFYRLQSDKYSAVKRMFYLN